MYSIFVIISEERWKYVRREIRGVDNILDDTWAVFEIHSRDDRINYIIPKYLLFNYQTSSEN